MALRTMIGRIQAAQEKLNKESADQIAAEIGKLLPAGGRLEWAQYTDYWNDGEPCTFSVHEWSFTTPEGVRIDEYSRFYPEARATYEGTISAIEESWKLFQKNEEVFQAAFGDHMMITVYADGQYLTEHCNHE